MVKLLIYIKHHLSFIWKFIEWSNSMLFFILFNKKVNQALIILNKNRNQPFTYRRLDNMDMKQLAEFFQRQPESAYTFFKPHKFDENSLRKKNKDHSFIMIGTFDGEKLIGYSFLRCFFNKQAFRGKIVDSKYQGRGIAKEMGKLTTEICLYMNFRIFATISKDNIKSIASSKAVNEVRIIKELPDNYLYVEYLLKK